MLASDMMTMYPMSFRHTSDVDLRTQRMNQDNRVSSSSMNVTVPHMMVVKEFTDGKDFEDCKNASSYCTFLMHRCSKNDAVMTLVGQPDGILDPTKPCSVTDVEKALCSVIDCGKFFIVSLNTSFHAIDKKNLNDVETERNGDEGEDSQIVYVKYPLVAWLSKRTDDGTVEGAQSLRLDRGEGMKWFTMFTPHMKQVLGKGMQKIMDYIFQAVYPSKSMEVFHHNMLKIRLFPYGTAQVCLRDEDVKDPVIMRQLDVGKNDTCDGLKCSDIPRKLHMTQDGKWSSCHFM